MIPVFLTKVKTRDGITLEGVYAKPEKKTRQNFSKKKLGGQAALIWIHGLNSRFSSGQPLVAALSKTCARAGIGYFKFNNRGNNIGVAGSKKQPLVGGGFERFSDCIKDIHAMIRFAKKLGYKNIILAGHSTGANKVLYCVYKRKDPSLKGIILLGPVSDIAGEEKRIGKKELKNRVALAARLVKKNPKAFMPFIFGKLISAKRFLSLYQPGKPEDVFPYHNPKALWKELKSVKIPTAVMVGSRDKYLDRPAKKFIDVFHANAQSTKSFSGIIIKGADHGFRKKEKEVSKIIIRFIRAVV